MEGKSTKNQLKNATQDGMPLGIDFFANSVDLGSQVGMQNPHKSVRLGAARRHGEAWRGVARRGVARRGVTWRGRRERRGGADLASTDTRGEGFNPG